MLSPLLFCIEFMYYESSKGTNSADVGFDIIVSIEVDWRVRDSEIILGQNQGLNKLSRKMMRMISRFFLSFVAKSMNQTSLLC